MILIGMFDSPFVRRVAVTMHWLGIQFEHRNWSVGKDFERIRQFNPLGRVPTLVLPDGEALIESSAILDFLDELAGSRRRGFRKSMNPRFGLRRSGISPGSSAAMHRCTRRLLFWISMPSRAPANGSSAIS